MTGFNVAFVRNPLTESRSTETVVLGVKLSTTMGLPRRRLARNCKLNIVATGACCPLTFTAGGAVCSHTSTGEGRK